jgi:hypothetical protein
MGSAEVSLDSLKLGDNSFQLKLEHSKNPKKSKGYLSIEITSIGFGNDMPALPKFVEIPEKSIEENLMNEIELLEDMEITSELELLKEELSDEESLVSPISASKDVNLEVFKVFAPLNTPQVEEPKVEQISIQIESPVEKQVNVKKKEVKISNPVKKNPTIEIKPFIESKEIQVKTIPTSVPLEMKPKELLVKVNQEFEIKPEIISQIKEIQDVVEIKEIQDVEIKQEKNEEEVSFVMESPKLDEQEIEMNQEEEELPKPFKMVKKVAQPKVQDPQILQLIEKKKVQEKKEKEVNERILLSKQELSHELLSQLHKEFLRALYTNEDLIITRNSPNSKGLVDSIFNILNYKTKTKYYVYQKSLIEIFTSHPAPQIQETLKYFKERNSQKLFIFNTPQLLK